MMAARSLIGVFRDLNPELLHKKDRGRPTSSEERKQLKYGEETVPTDVFGADLLMYKSNKDDQHESKSESQWNEWEEASDDEEEDSDSWINVNSEDDQDKIDVSLSDEEEKDTSRENPLPFITIEKVCKLFLEDSYVLQILSPADFALIEKLQAKIATKKRKSSDSGICDNEDIHSFLKKKKATYEERLESIKKGREGRIKYGTKKGKVERGSTTNKEKQKKKNQVMLSHKSSILLKNKLSLKEKQVINFL